MEASKKLTAHFAFRSINKLRFDVCHEARQSSLLCSPVQAVTDHHEVASISLGEVNRERCSVSA